MNRRTPLPQEELDRLCDLATLGASLASVALGELVELPVSPGITRVCPPTDPIRADTWSTGNALIMKRLRRRTAKAISTNLCKCCGPISTALNP